ncbi:MAG: hypothetical protein AAGD11_07870 [Planctomycetota bacterium]
MRLSCVALALTLCTLVPISAGNAQQEETVGPPPLTDLVNPAEPQPTQAEDLSPNPFRESTPQESAAESSAGPGFSEASDQGSIEPIPQLTAPPTPSPIVPSPTPTPSPFSSTSSATSASTSQDSNNSFSPRLARAAPIMGDSLSPSLRFVDPFDDTVAEIPTGGGATRRKIGENTGALPTDRIIFNYNNFQNAVNSISEATNIDRFTLGVEKAFMDGLFSIDVRLPLSANNDFADANVPFSRNGSELGNVSAALKVLLTSEENYALAAGMVVDTPTGSATNILLPNSATLKLNNDAVHLAPFLGFLFLQNGGLIHQGFLQVDVATNANGVVYSEVTDVVTNFEEQTLLYVDYALSKAVYEARSSQDILQRLSGHVEFHYTTTLEDSDEIEIAAPNTDFTMRSQGNRIDVMNLTLGLDTLLSCGANLRFGTVVPLTKCDDRFFDIEFLAQVNFAL